MTKIQTYDLNELLVDELEITEENGDKFGEILMRAMSDESIKKVVLIK